MPLDVPDATLPELAIHATLAPTDDDDHFTAMFDGSIDQRLHPDLPPTGPGEFATHVAADGHATVTDGPNVRLGGRRGPPVGSDPTLAVILSFDITDALMRGHGMDPYASAKLRVLDATRDARTQRGLAYRARQLEHTPTLAAANIDHVFATIHDPVAQRRALTELWSECATTGSSELVAAGAYARALIVDAARRHHLAGFDPNMP